MHEGTKGRHEGGGCLPRVLLLRSAPRRRLARALLLDEPPRRLLALPGLRRALLLRLRGLLWRGCLSYDTALFWRLVLGWIEADFRIQIRIFLAFFKIYKKIIFSRANLANFCQKIGKFVKILIFLGKFCKILQNFQKSAKFLQIFAEFFTY